MATSIVATTAARTTWQRVSSTPAKYPFAFGVLFSGVKTSAADVLVQKVVERKERIDWKRNSAFAAFGFVYLGAVQYAIYVPLFGRLFPSAASFVAKSIRDKVKDVRGMFQLGGQVVLDQFVHHPFMYFPAFYMTKEAVMSSQPDLLRALNDYKRNMKEDLLALWKIWVPATLVNFSFMPMYMRIPFVAGVSLLWTCILSTMRGGDVAHGEDMAGGAVTGATLTYMTEGLGTLFTQPLELDRDMSHIMITASGHDKPGWVATLSRAVANEGGNVTHSKMVRLGQEFIIQMHVSVKPDEHRKLVNALKKNQILKPLQVQCNTIKRRHTGTYEAPVLGVRIRCVGDDR
jgi:predicted amino acid-binding ACT domain protein